MASPNVPEVIPVNERLRTGMAAAHVDVDTVVDATGVDPKTVRRWINGRTPNARFRSKLASLVGEEETYLWPELVDGDRARAASESELVALYPHRADVPPDLWPTLLRRAERAIDILAYAALAGSALQRAT